MADTAMSKRLEIRPGIRPLKSMSTHSTCLPMVLAIASTSSTSKPVRLPFSTNSMGGNVASVPTRRTLSWACAPVVQKAAAGPGGGRKGVGGGVGGKGWGGGGEEKGGEGGGGGGRPAAPTPGRGGAPPFFGPAWP